jgi:hypothetical protein
MTVLTRLALTSLVLTLACNGKSASPASSPSTASATAATQPNWVHFTDSAEGAFSMDVPYGWQVQGGMYRFGYFDVRWMMDVRSLDGKVVIRIDDVNIPPYTLPGPNTGKQGQPYIKPQQMQMMVSSYQKAADYAPTYAKSRFNSVCTAMTTRAPDWTPTLPAAWKLDASAQSTNVSLAYDCPTSDGARIIAMYLRTQLFPASGLWTVDPAISIIATADQMPLAHSMVQHMIDSWQETPQWAQYQQQMTQAGLQQIMQGFNQFMQQMKAFDQQRTAAMNQQVAGFEAKQNAQAAQVSSFGEILTGLTTVQDPQTGTQFQIFSGPQANYYTNGNGVTINSTFSPGPSFHQVNQVPQP